MTELGLITCDGCRKRFHMSEFRYDMRGENLICKECFDASKGNKSTTPSIHDLKPKKLESTGPREREEEELIRFYCADCRYKFTRKKGFPFVICPSCSTPGTIREERNMSSNELLEDSGNIFG